MIDRTKTRELLRKAERFARDGLETFKLKNALRALRFATDEAARVAALRRLEKILSGIEAGERKTPAALTAAGVGFAGRRFSGPIEPVCSSETTQSMVRAANHESTAADRGLEPHTMELIEAANGSGCVY